MVLSMDNYLPTLDVHPYLSGMYLKIYHDGAHHMGSVVSQKRSRSTARSSPCEEEIFFAECYQEELKSKVKKQIAKARAQTRLLKKFLADEEDKEETQHLIDLADEVAVKLHKNAFARKKRFRRKAYLNEWSYFATFTYDGLKVPSAEAFEKKLEKFLANTSTRHGWKCMGAWERGELGERRHFHCLLYVPEGELMGYIRESESYSFKKHEKQITHVHSFIERKFGLNDFQRIDENNLGAKIEYILKYIEKDGEAVRYSRGIPSEVLFYIDCKDLVLGYSDFVWKFLIMDGVVIWSRDVAGFNKRDNDRIRRYVDFVLQKGTLLSA